jgi:hypothetical protein
MKCIDVKEKLSAYIDGVLSVEENSGVDEHLTLCAACRNVLRDLKNTIKQIQNIQEVEPPPWFEKQVMASVKAECKSGKSLIDRLFFPFHIKLPLGALATFVIVAASIYVYKATQPDLQMSELSLMQQAPEMRTEQASRFPGKEKNISASKIPAGGSLTEKENKMSEDMVENVPEASDVLSKKDESLPFTGVFEDEKASKKSSLRPFESREKRETLFSGKGTDNTILIQVENINIASGLIKSIIEELDGNIHSGALEEEKYIINATLSNDSVDEFLSELKFVGKVSSEEFGLQTRADTEGAAIDIVIILSE